MVINPVKKWFRESSKPGIGGTLVTPFMKMINLATPLFYLYYKTAIDKLRKADKKIKIEAKPAQLYNIFSLKKTQENRATPVS